MQDQTVRVTANRAISPDFLEVEFEWRRDFGLPAPGQFFELRITETTAPLLRRPYAFSGYDPDRQVAAMVYQVRGQSTQMLARREPGQTVRVLGPLGNAFGLDGRPEKVVAVAGGVGLGPILFAARDIAAAGSAVRVVAGFRTRDLIPDRGLWHGLETAVCTDDGSEGFAGNVVDHLRSLPAADLDGARLLACGPMPMLAATHRFAQERGLVCEVSVEEMMACGLGVCVGCVVERADGEMVRVCTDGPIFDSGVLAWT
ncbi:MAG: dihydroorotate dehydrogenase electron transfer subunit [Hyphomicrobiales bacterium]|nr:dihydroorotate dehydrogenase electron transfer subunit [Hyphomicrobiales bacterium]